MRGMMNRYVQAPYLSPGFSDFGVYHKVNDMGVGCESDDRKVFVGLVDTLIYDRRRRYRIGHIY